MKFLELWGHNMKDKRRRTRLENKLKWPLVFHDWFHESLGNDDGASRRHWQLRFTVYRRPQLRSDDTTEELKSRRRF
ncbi:hypothetical protein Bca4012_009544 [Brassica carinata]